MLLQQNKHRNCRANAQSVFTCGQYRLLRSMLY